MESLPLFVNKKEIFVTFCVLLILFCFSVGHEYVKYKNLTDKPLHVTQAKVLNHYQKSKKNGRVYDVLKLKSAEGYTFYTVSWKKRDIPISSSLLVKFKTDKISFLSYMKNFFAVNIFIKAINSTKSSYLQKAKNYITNQHKSSELKEVFSALFFATNIEKATRAKIQKLGISHLVAISGFHLGLISLILYFLFTPIYKFFQNLYFPYRNRKADLSFVVFFVLFFYMYIIDFSPSFLRSFVMAIFGFFLFSRHIKIISFGTLLLSISLILILFPKLIFSISFWFSVSGVFYIFLFLKHFSYLNKILIFVLLNFWVYVTMIPIVHFVFEVFTPLQLASPILSMLFTVFYPLELFLHAINLGGLLDGGIEYLLNLQSSFYVITTPLWFLLPYVILSIFSIYYKRLAIFIFFIAFAVFFI